MIRFDKIKDGDILYDCHKHYAGNTRMKVWGSWPVRVIRVDFNAALVSWNGNPPAVWSRRRLEKLRRTPRKEANYGLAS